MVRNTHHDDDDDDVDDDDGREPCRGQNENSKKGQHLALSESASERARASERNLLEGIQP